MCVIRNAGELATITKKNEEFEIQLKNIVSLFLIFPINFITWDVSK